MANYVYQDPVTGEKFEFEKKYPRSNPVNNAQLVFLGEKGSREAAGDIRQLTFDGLQRIILSVTSITELNSLSRIELRKDLYTKEQLQKLNELISRRERELREADNAAEQKEKKELAEVEARTVSAIMSKIKAAKTVKELNAIHEVGKGIDGISNTAIVKVDEAFRDRMKELGQ